MLFLVSIKKNVWSFKIIGKVDFVTKRKQTYFQVRILLALAVVKRKEAGILKYMFIKVRFQALVSDIIT